jgi:CPA1 family monovalent cation:H+ antiporter
MIIAYGAKYSVTPFIDDFELTPDLLFYVFLPILLFESAYTIRYKELLRNIRSISALAIVSLIISAFCIAIVLHFVFGWIGFEIPFIVTLLFGTLISSTDTAAALSIFKELGVPRRLNLIFEGESLFNDGTAIALFFVVLGVIESHATGGVPIAHMSLYESTLDVFSNSLWSTWFPIVKWIISLASMIIFGIIVGAFSGIIFSKVIQKIRNDSYLEITLSLALAHATFLVAELINHSLFPVSGIIATVAAAMILGNYGRYKISPKVEEVMERYWGFFAFVTNSLVFILVGMMLVNLHVNWRPLLLPILITIPVVIFARALSVYSVFWFLNFLKKEERVPRSWQHVLSWGALRGWLAVMMVLLIPTWIILPEWQLQWVSLRDFLLSLTIGTVIFSIFVKTITIAPLIRHFQIDKLHDIEEFEYIESRMLMTTKSIEKIIKIRAGGYIDQGEAELLTKKYQKTLSDAQDDAKKLMEKHGDNFGILVQRVATLHALGIEKYWLRHMYKSNEIPEIVFKNIMNRVVTQIRRVERWENQILTVKNIKPKPDIFEQITEYIIDRLEPKIDPIKEQYLETRTIHIIIEKALEWLTELGNIDFIGQRREFKEVIALYEWFRNQAESERRILFRTHKEFLRKLSATLTEKSLLVSEELILEDLAAKEIISPKLVLKFKKNITLRMGGNE